MVVLKPSFLLVLLKVGGACCLITGLCYLCGHPGHWPDIQSVLGVVVGATCLSVLVWFMFVPRRLAFSDNEITLSTILGTSTYRWSTLGGYAWGRGVFMIQFEDDRRAYQISASAYPKAEWSKLMSLLTERYPDRLVRFYIGANLLRK